MLQVRLLGQFDVRTDGKRVLIPSRAGQSLFAFLILTAGTAHRREKLAGQFWPDTLDENARGNLRRELWRIRKALSSQDSPASEYLLAEELTITFDPQSEYWLDVAQLERNLPPEDSLNTRLNQVSVYQGELLPGFYEDWVVLERERLQALFEDKMQRLLERLVSEERWATVLEWGEKWLALGNTPEPAYRALMLAHAARGDMAKVAALYQRCVEALRDDLGVEPSVETRTLYEGLVQGAQAPTRGVSVQPVGPGIFQAAPPKDSLALTQAPAPGEPPFKGLEYFDVADADLFFGRELLTAKLVTRLRESQFLSVIVGASGSGKSSIVRAGLVPALKTGESLADGALPPAGSRNWEIHILTPTAHPLTALATSLTRDSESVTATATLIDDLAREPRSLDLYVRRRLADHGPHLLLVVDQFEELFTLCRDEFEREAFIDNLITAVAPDGAGAVTLILTLRADFYAHLAQYPELREAVAKQQEYIGPMTAEELRRAMEEPARRGGWEFEPGLVDLILRDVGDEPGALPLLSHALLETWKRRSGHRLTLKGYQASGGVRGAIAQTAETTFQQLSPEQQTMARNVFLRLTELGEGTEDTRRRAAFDELIPHGEDAVQVRAVLKMLADARLITLGADSAEVAHEALIREWGRLREWLSADREGLRLHRHLTEAAQEWELLEREPGALYRGAHLAQAREWAGANPQALNAQERAFLEASQEWAEREAAEREAQRQRELEAARKLTEEQSRAARQLRRRAYFLASAFLLAIVLAFVALFLGEQARVSANTAQDNANRADQERRVEFARELAATAVSNLDVDPERSILLALQAISVGRPLGGSALSNAEEALHHAVVSSRLRFTLRGHTKTVSGVAFSPDGTRLASFSFDGSAKMWDTKSGRELLTLKTGFTSANWDAVHGIAFSPDGKLIATVITGDGDKVALWDASTGAALPTTFCCHANTITSITFSRDGTRLATSSSDGYAYIWDVSSGNRIRTISIGSNAAAFSPDGTRLVTDYWELDSNNVSYNGAAVWDVSTGEKLLTLGKSAYGLAGVQYSPDGKQIATASYDDTAQVWDSDSGQLLHTLIGHFAPLNGIAFSADGTQLATASNDGTAIIWDTATGRQLLVLRGHSGPVLDVAFSPDGKSVATASNDATVRVWDVSAEGSREWLTFAGHMGFVQDVRYSPDGTRIASVDDGGGVQVWDAATGQVLLRAPMGVAYNHGIAFSPDGKRLAVADDTKDTEVWDSATGEKLLTLHTPLFAGSLFYGYLVDYSPDGKYIITGNGTAVMVWDAVSGKQVPGISFDASAMAFSRDGKHLALANKTNIYDTQTWNAVLSLSGYTGTVNSIAYSPDSTQIAIALFEGTVKVWDATTGKELYTLYSQTSAVNRAAFSPDGKYLAALVARGVIKLWDLSQVGQPDAQPLSLYGHTRRVVALAFSPDGKRLATAGDDGTVRVYALDLDDLIAIAKSRVTRTLTADECQEYLHEQTCPPGP